MDDSQEDMYIKENCIGEIKSEKNRRKRRKNKFEF